MSIHVVALAVAVAVIAAGAAVVAAAVDWVPRRRNYLAHRDHTPLEIQRQQPDDRHPLQLDTWLVQSADSQSWLHSCIHLETRVSEWKIEQKEIRTHFTYQH